MTQAELGNITEAQYESLKKAGIRGSKKATAQFLDQFGADPLALRIVTAYLKRWYAGNLRGIASLPKLANHKGHQDHALYRVLSALETKLAGASDLTLLQLVSLSEKPVPEQAFRDVFKTTFMERWITGRDNYIRFINPLGRLGSDHWHWVVENLRRLQLLAPENPDLPDAMFAHPRIQDYFCRQLKIRQPDVFKQASLEMDKLHQDNIIKWPAQKSETNNIIENQPTPEETNTELWDRHEIDQAGDQLRELREALKTLSAHTDSLDQHIKVVKASKPNK